MKNLKMLALIGALGLFILGNMAQAQTSDGPPLPPLPPGADTGTVEDPPTPPTDGDEDGVKPPKPDNKPENKGRPPQHARPNVPKAVQDLITQLQQARADFIANQKRLGQELKGKSAEEREKLRAVIQANREALLEKMRDLRIDIKESLADIRENFANNRDRALDAAKEKAKDKARERKGEN